MMLIRVEAELCCSSCGHPQSLTFSLPKEDFGDSVCEPCGSVGTLWILSLKQA